MHQIREPTVFFDLNWHPIEARRDSGPETVGAKYWKCTPCGSRQPGGLFRLGRPWQESEDRASATLAEEPAHAERAGNEHAGPQFVVLPPEAAGVIFDGPLASESRPRVLFALAVTLMLRRQAND